MKITHEWDLSDPKDKKEYEEREGSQFLKGALEERLERKLKCIKKDIDFVLSRKNETEKLAPYVFEKLEQIKWVVDE